MRSLSDTRSLVDTRFFDTQSLFGQDLIIIGVQFHAINHVDDKRTPNVVHEELSDLVDSDKAVQLNELVATNEAVYELGKLAVAIDLYLAVHFYLPYRGRARQ